MGHRPCLGLLPELAGYVMLPSSSCATSQKMDKVFISYSRHDESTVRELSKLVGVGVDQQVFLDVASLKPGDKWRTRIQEAIQRAPVFLLFWCCHCEQSTSVAEEIGIALADENKLMVPVRLCKCSVPRSLSDRQWIDLREYAKHPCTGYCLASGDDGKPLAEPKKMTRESVITGLAVTDPTYFPWVTALVYVMRRIKGWRDRHPEGLNVAQQVALHLVNLSEL